MASVLQPQASLVMTPENSPEALTISIPALEPSCTVPLPASALIWVAKLSATLNVAPAPTVTRLELEMSALPDRASVPALIVVAPV
jgi:hypothetical protein